MSEHQSNNSNTFNEFKVPSIPSKCFKSSTNTKGNSIDTKDHRPASQSGHQHSGATSHRNHHQVVGRTGNNAHYDKLSGPHNPREGYDLYKQSTSTASHVQAGSGASGHGDWRLRSSTTEDAKTTSPETSVGQYKKPISFQRRFHPSPNSVNWRMKIPTGCNDDNWRDKAPAVANDADCRSKAPALVTDEDYGLERPPLVIDEDYGLERPAANICGLDFSSSSSFSADGTTPSLGSHIGGSLRSEAPSLGGNTSSMPSNIVNTYGCNNGSSSKQNLERWPKQVPGIATASGSEEKMSGKAEINWIIDSMFSSNNTTDPEKVNSTSGSLYPSMPSLMDLLFHDTAQQSTGTSLAHRPQPSARAGPNLPRAPPPPSSTSASTQPSVLSALLGQTPNQGDVAAILVSNPRWPCPENISKLPEFDEYVQYMNPKLGVIGKRVPYLCDPIRIFSCRHLGEVVQLCAKVNLMSQVLLDWWHLVDDEQRTLCVKLAIKLFTTHCLQHDSWQWPEPELLRSGDKLRYEKWIKEQMDFKAHFDQLPGLDEHTRTMVNIEVDKNDLACFKRNGFQYIRANLPKNERMIPCCDEIIELLHNNGPYQSRKCAGWIDLIHFGNL